ncbi:MAG: hypothetical protein WAR77_03635 [Saprospiraceae bacterium]
MNKIENLNKIIETVQQDGINYKNVTRELGYIDDEINRLKSNVFDTEKDFENLMDLEKKKNDIKCKLDTMKNTFEKYINEIKDIIPIGVKVQVIYNQVMEHKENGEINISNKSLPPKKQDAMPSKPLFNKCFMENED